MLQPGDADLLEPVPLDRNPGQPAGDLGEHGHRAARGGARRAQRAAARESIAALAAFSSLSLAHIREARLASRAQSRGSRLLFRWLDVHASSATAGARLCSTLHGLCVRACAPLGVWVRCYMRLPHAMVSLAHRMTPCGHGIHVRDLGSMAVASRAPEMVSRAPRALSLFLLESNYFFAETHSLSLSHTFFPIVCPAYL